MKPFQLQRNTKKRESGLRARDFLPHRFDVFQKPQIDAQHDGTWLIGELAHVHNDVCETDFNYILRECLQSLIFSPSAARMISEVAHHDWRIGIEDLGERDFHLDVPAKIVMLHDQGLGPEGFARSDYFRNALKVCLIRALRDIWQEIRHGGFDEDYAPDYILLLERVRAADCDVLSILVGWELRSEGQGNFWRHLIGSDEGDMAMTFSAYLERDPASQFNGRALAEAFKQWFNDPVRVNSCDHETLCYMDDILQEYPVGNPFGKRKPTHIGVEILSCLPDKTPYLRGLGDEILSDPAYSGLQDDINQAHFMQITHDMCVTYVEGVPFRDTMLAEKIFPDVFVFEGTGSIN